MSSQTYPNLGSGAISYPSPYFDIASTFLPKTWKEMMRWYKYYSVMDDIAASTIERLASFPVTRIIFEEKNPEQRKIYESVFLHQMGLKARSREIGLDYHTFGICLVSLQFPFTRWLICPQCKHIDKIERVEWTWKRMQFVGRCKACDTRDVKFVIRDTYKPQKTGIRVRRWDPEQVEVRAADECHGEVFYYEVSKPTREAIERGDRYVLQYVPKAMLDAVRMGGVIRLDPSKVFVFKRAARSDSSTPGFGVSILAGVLKKLFYKQVLLKAQEALAKQHIVPLWILFPAAGANVDPFQEMNIANWRSRVERDINRWKRDPNYMPIMPIAVDVKQIGGDQAEAGIHQQLDAINKDVIAGMGVPQELVMGGLSYSSASVTVRLLENYFLSYQDDLLRVLQHFVVDNVCQFLGLKPVTIRLQQLKMVDDVQQKAQLFQMAMQGVLSKHTLLEAFDIDYDADKEWRRKELKDQAEEMIEQAVATARAQAASNEAAQKAQIRMQMRMQKIQMEVAEELQGQAGMDSQAIAAAQAEMEAQGGPVQIGPDGAPIQQPGAPGSEGEVAPGVGMQAAGADMQNQQKAVDAHARTLLSVPGDLRQQLLDQMSVTDPEYASAVQQRMSAAGVEDTAGGSSKKPKPGQVDKRPQPKQKPPRRATKSI